MKLNDLVNLACEKSPEFQRKMDYWKARNVHKPLDIDWLMPRLEEALGAEFVQECAQAELERQERELAMEGEQDGGKTDEVQA